MATTGLGVSATTRLAVSAVAGVATGVAVSLLATWRYGLLVGWIVTAVIFLSWMWLRIWPMDAEATSAHALREDPGKAVTEVTVLLASVASLAAVVLLLTGASSGGSGLIQAAVSVGGVAAAWASVHTIFAIRYARLYYADDPGGIEFNQDEPPAYADFAYLALTLGMTYQVSDTDLKTGEIRRTALRHALLSFLFGTFIIATTINLVAGLAK